MTCLMWSDDILEWSRRMDHELTRENQIRVGELSMSDVNEAPPSVCLAKFGMHDRCEVG